MITAVLRSELLKQRSTYTAVGLLVAMLGLVFFAVLLHGLSLPADALETRSDQMMVFGWGRLGALFAGLLGAMAMTGEIRHGTIRPTFLVTPRRSRVVAAKMGVAALAGSLLGLVAEGVAIPVGSAALASRGIESQLDGGDLALLFAGGAAASALWGPIGAGIGALVRNQVATLVGLFLWLLFVESLLAAWVPSVGRFAPGAAGAAITGQDTNDLLSPAIGALVLAVWATAATSAGWIATLRRDVA